MLYGQPWRHSLRALISSQLVGSLVTEPPSGKRRAQPYMVEPMPADAKEIAELKQILRWATTRRKHLSAPEQVLTDALARAIAYIEAPGKRKNILLFILSALRRSMARRDNIWVCIDRELQTDALDLLAAMIPGDSVHERVTLRDVDDKKTEH